MTLKREEQSNNLDIVLTNLNIYNRPDIIRHHTSKSTNQLKTNAFISCGKYYEVGHLIGGIQFKTLSYGLLLH
jgi:hypothetical protein